MRVPTLLEGCTGTFWGGGILGICVVIYQFAAYLGADKTNAWGGTAASATVAGAVLVFVGAVGDTWLEGRGGSVVPIGKTE